MNSSQSRHQPDPSRALSASEGPDKSPGTHPALRPPEAGSGHGFEGSHARRHDPRQRGVVIIIALLALVLMASLLFYVFNTGRNIQSRIVTQNAADASAMAGATHVARSMNSVAMNNVEMARLIAAVNVLDATDEALHPAYHEAQTHFDALDALYPSAGGNLMSREAAIIRDQMDPIIADYDHDLLHLRPVKETFRAPAEPAEYRTPSGPVDVTEYTFYNGPAGRGNLWRAIEALDLYSQTIMENLGPLTQVTAAQGGRVNLTGRGEAHTGQALVVPVLPELPWERGRFDDFQRPVEHGLLKKGVDDKQYRRGPYDTVFGWRSPKRKREKVSDGEWVPGGPPSQGDGPGGPGGIGPPDLGGGGHHDPPPTFRTIITGYHVFGPQHWLLHHHRGGRDFRLRRSPLESDRNRFAQWKLQMLWHGRGETRYRFPVFRNTWPGITDAADSGGGGGQTIHRTRYFVARVESDFKPGTAQYLMPGTYQIVDPGRIVTISGDWTVPTDACAPLSAGFGSDPRAWQEVLERFVNDCPRFDTLSSTAKDYWLSAEFENLQGSDWRKTRFISKIRRQVEDEDGDLVWEEKWQVIYYFTLAVDVGQELPIRNPHNFSGRGGLPAPIDLNHAELEHDDDAAQRDTLTFLGSAQLSNAGTFWAPRFTDSDSYGHHVALAQARVFNNHSWDLWTQMWHAQLEPIDDYPAWVARMEDEAGDADAIPGMTGAEYDALAEHLRTLEPLAEVMLQH